jgi:predicted ATP-grasp superfamily ATP-dependent carboligase
MTTPDPTPLLIAGVTGRALAESAVRGGYRPIVLDYFGDSDTRAVATEVRVVVSSRQLRFHRRKLLAAAAEFPGVPLLYGSGFEGRIDLLSQLGVGRLVLGNLPKVVTRVRDPRTFFALLDELALPHPEVAFAAPADLAGWLVKDGGGAGGIRVRLATRPTTRAQQYYQRLEPGIPMSALFIADGHAAQLLGINEQWTASQPGLPFLYGGAISRIRVAPGIEHAVTEALTALVRATGLRGINGLDFLLHQERWSILELNPRPTATMELYDQDAPNGLVAAHIAASRGQLPAPLPSGPSRAAMVVHATEGWIVPEHFRFPVWCKDLPAPGLRIRQGEPICTVHAEAENPGFARALVLERAEHRW